MTNINKLLDYYDEYAFIQIIKAFQIALHLNKSESLINDILKLKKIEKPLPLIIKEIDEKLTDLPNLEMKKSPHELQNHSIASIYYAISIALKVNKYDYKFYKNNIHIKKITYIALRYQYFYFKYKKEEQTVEKKQSNDFYEKIVITLIRTIEILFRFAAKQDEEYFENLALNYFPKTQKYLEENFINIIRDHNSKERLFYTIKEDTKESNFISYNNTDFGHEIQVASSRKLKKGTSNNSDKNDENFKIISYLEDGYVAYEKLSGLTFKKQEVIKKTGYSVTQGKLHDTIQDDLLDGIFVSDKRLEETFDTEDLNDAYNKAKKRTEILHQARIIHSKIYISKESKINLLVQILQSVLFY